MTDSSPGPGWWLASDGNWYPPHLHPDARAREAALAAAPAEGTELGRASVADSVARVSETETEILSAFRQTPSTPAYTASEPELDATRPLGAAAHDVLSTTGGGIDWEAVARERAAQREARQRQASPFHDRRKLIGAGVGILALALLAFLALRGGDGKDTTVTTPGTSTSQGPARTPSGATGSGATASTTRPASTTAGGPATTGSTGSSGSTGAVSVFALAPGSCIDQSDLTTGLITTVRTVSCEQPHTHEVYLKTTVTPADATYDAAKVTAFANQACSDGFKVYVGIAYEQSQYYFLHLAPSAESWNKNKDRDVVCLLLLEGQKLTGSVKGQNK